jgi:hypothetical protein
MPLHFGKIFGFLALLTVIAFVLWLLWGSIFAGETFDKRAAPRTPSWLSCRWRSRTRTLAPWGPGSWRSALVARSDTN